VPNREHNPSVLGPAGASGWTGGVAGDHGWGGGREGAAVAMATAVSAVALGLWGAALLAGVRLSVWLTPRPEPPLPAFHVRLAALPAGPMLEVEDAARGRDVFVQTCGVCHGPGGRGMAGLGKDLLHSDFVAGLEDGPLAEFITKGRDASDPANTTKLPMPPRGGNAGLADADIRAVVTYLRGLQDPRRMPELPAYVLRAPALSEADKAKALAAAGGDADLAAYIESGTRLYNATCIACHGAGGEGIKGNGKTLRSNDFIASVSDDDLLAFLKAGRSPTDPKNTTGIQMPPKGGNPALSEDDLLDVISYLRTLQGGKPEPKPGT